MLSLLAALLKIAHVVCTVKMDVSALICTVLLDNSTFIKIKNDVILDGNIILIIKKETL